MAEKPNSGKKDVQAFVIGSLFILALVFATYNYFSAPSNEAIETGEEKSTIEKLKDIVSSNTQREEEEAAAQEEEVAGTSESADTSGVYWVATDYEEGDIQAGTYTVKSGDTLWEIAEAVYGNGAEWTRILNANSGSVGYLPNGQQALIMVGQTLTIPQM